MKKIVVIVCAFLAICLSSFAQQREVIRVSGKDYPAFKTREQYKFPEFTRSEIYLKNGDTAFVRINLDYFDQHIKYVGANGDTMNLVTKDIKYITAGADTIFNENKQLYEWIGSTSLARLAVRHEMVYSSSETPNGIYGSSSSSTKVESHKAFLGGVQLESNDVLVFRSETTYYIEMIKDGNFVVANKKNLAELFPNSDIEDYIDDNKLDLNNVDDLLKAFSHAHKRKK